jgi:hypothetical protein
MKCVVHLRIIWTSENVFSVKKLLFYCKFIGILSEHVVKLLTPLELDGKLNENAGKNCGHARILAKLRTVTLRDKLSNRDLPDLRYRKRIYQTRMFKGISTSFQPSEDFKPEATIISVLFWYFRAFLFGTNHFGVQRETLLFNGATNSFNGFWDNKWQCESLLLGMAFGS